MLLDLVPEDYRQGHLFACQDSSKADHLMRIVDDINRVMGPNTVFHAAQGTKHDWRMRCDNRSQRYTTQWDELVQVL